jgi:hypothetical protein
MFERSMCLAMTAAVIGVMALGQTAFAQGSRPVEATTPTGEKIRLYPDGRWEYADPAKRAANPAPAAAPGAATASPQAAAPAVAASPAGACPPDSQGHLLWVGRCVLPGDRDYNRGSLSGKGR